MSCKLLVKINIYNVNQLTFSDPFAVMFESICCCYSRWLLLELPSQSTALGLGCASPSYAYPSVSSAADLARNLQRLGRYKRRNSLQTPHSSRSEDLRNAVPVPAPVVATLVVVFCVLLRHLGSTFAAQCLPATSCGICNRSCPSSTSAGGIIIGLCGTWAATVVAATAAGIWVGFTTGELSRASRTWLNRMIEASIPCAQKKQNYCEFEFNLALWISY